jgi:hypothetical protein
MKPISELTTDDILCVYSGRSGCACGCRGIYRYNPDHKKEAQKDYSSTTILEKKDFNLNQIKRILRVFQENAERVESYPDSPGFVGLDLEDKCYTLYFRQGHTK